MSKAVGAIVSLVLALRCSSAVAAPCATDDASCANDEAQETVSLLATPARARAPIAREGFFKWCLLGYECAPMDWADCPGDLKGIPIPCFPCFYNLGNDCSEDAETAQSNALKAPLPEFGNKTLMKKLNITPSSADDVIAPDYNSADPVTLSWCLLGYRGAPWPWSECPGTFQPLGIPIPCLPCFYGASP